MIHQLFFWPRANHENEKLVEQVLPVIGRHKIDLVLQGQGHTDGRRGNEAGQATPVFLVSVDGPKQYRLSDRRARPCAQ
ncbi:hypothetical protein K4A87_06445 [Xanthomonas fragariae]|nr:hypothetical protein K4A87_06445 [Xanthomonas fragariae]